MCQAVVVDLKCVTPFGQAVVADLAEPADRAGALAKVGLAAGLGFMVGPLASPFVKSFDQVR